MSEFSHMNQQGRAKMVDITEKQTTHRTAKARSSIFVSDTIHDKIVDQSIEKGDVLSVGQIAGVMGAKQTANVIPMCHPLPLSGVDIQFTWKKASEGYELIFTVTVKTKGSTGVEMEALTAASITALTIYDMCKALDKGMVIGQTYLIEKTGGKSGDYHREDESE
ncbi:molybdenum cofactor biosynthesis protein MoaC [Gracilibacillus halophilus YIM-C55.5]|uniref:Cyclic pyranopterin monophosphate synthase n=1 Tax=Gracilibacillus halophilus YIM-C55.5 TaxID=1308866 RepID=N4W6A3_9BACI|nr:cyclic pyranopterin monophosphate synthase MoaC [Gracilibacillus halophilus]ENH95738.1 molybdenum cofactor biosynthesis protein MoaC [Gracilibacillus halophilus YIM-C55.5]